MTSILRRVGNGLRWLLVGAAAFAVVAATGLALGAGTGVLDDSRHHLEFSPVGYAAAAEPAAATIDRERAVEVARGAVPDARVISAELDTGRANPVWEVELRDARGEDVDVTVDAVNATVLAVDHDDD
ncbi:PepSY domain-containing protein [Nocardia spumae]|uniref:PepSY domain-containing protein n=1 Tax=Nocardia spumae TaxID=2887190 RepID=UPI001D14FC61|nr:PepSY domain-containing protein [Nocardia spumae]